MAKTPAAKTTAKAPAAAAAPAPASPFAQPEAATPHVEQAKGPHDGPGETQAQAYATGTFENDPQFEPGAAGATPPLVQAVVPDPFEELARAEEAAAASEPAADLAEVPSYLIRMTHPDGGTSDAFDKDEDGSGAILVPVGQVGAMQSHGFVVEHR